MKKEKIYTLDMRLYKEIIPPPNAEKKRHSREKVLECAGQTHYFMTDRQFLLYQIQFMKKRTVIGQLLVMGAAIFAILERLSPDMIDWQLLSVISAVTPLFLLFQIEEVARIYAGGVLELEMATKFSLKKLMVSRMLTLGFADIIVLSVFIGFVKMQLKENLIDLLLYSLVPFQMGLVAIFILLVMKRWEHFVVTAVCLVILISQGFGVLQSSRINIYGEGTFVYWVIAYIVTLAAVIGLFVKMKKQAEQMNGLLLA